jgi:hypothetical protein
VKASNLGRRSWHNETPEALDRQKLEQRGGDARNLIFDVRKIPD